MPPKTPAKRVRRRAPAKPSTDRTATFAGAADATSRVRLDDGQTFPLGVPVPVDAKTAKQLHELADQLGLRFDITTPSTGDPTP